jgi:hypothetical protein
MASSEWGSTFVAATLSLFYSPFAVPCYFGSRPIR